MQNFYAKLSLTFARLRSIIIAIKKGVQRFLYMLAATVLCYTGYTLFTPSHALAGSGCNCNSGSQCPVLDVCADDCHNSQSGTCRATRASADFSTSMWLG